MTYIRRQILSWSPISNCDGNEKKNRKNITIYFAILAKSLPQNVSSRCFLSIGLRDATFLLNRSRKRTQSELKWWNFPLLAMRQGEASFHLPRATIGWIWWKEASVNQRWNRIFGCRSFYWLHRKKKNESGIGDFRN